MSGWIVRIDDQRTLKPIDGIAMVAGVVSQHAEQVKRFGVVRFYAQDLPA
jgi:hypothetical protein